MENPVNHSAIAHNQYSVWPSPGHYICGLAAAHSKQINTAAALQEGSET